MQLNLMTSLSTTGYGIVGKNVALELTKQNIDVKIWPYGGVADDEFQNTLTDMVQSNFKGNAPCLNIWHQFDLAKRIGTGVYYAWPFFELNKFTEIEKKHLSIPHYIIVSSQWAKDIIEEQINTKVYVVPCGVDRKIFDNVVDVEEKCHNHPYTFFNIGKWEKRKGHDVLVRAFDKAFDYKDDVHLVMLAHNPFLREYQQKYWVDMYNGAKLCSKITLLDSKPHHKDVAKLINQCDCGVFPSRAEGWNLELLEAMSCGKPVIVTSCSAHTEFCTPKNSYLIDTPNLEDAYDGIWFTGQGQWAEFEDEQEEQLIEYMRYCYKERPSNSHGIETAKQFSWANTAKKLKEILYAKENR